MHSYLKNLLDEIKARKVDLQSIVAESLSLRWPEEMFINAELAVIDRVISILENEQLTEEQVNQELKSFLEEHWQNTQGNYLEYDLPVKCNRTEICSA